MVRSIRKRARPVDFGDRDDQAPIGELQEVVEAIAGAAAGHAHGIDLLDVEAAIEHGELVEQMLECGIEQVVTPSDR